MTSAQPYAWPYHGAFDASRCALVACLDARWRVVGAEADVSDARLARLAGWLRGAGGLVIGMAELPIRRPAGTAVGPQAPAALPVGRTAGPERLPAADRTLAAAGTSAFHGSALDTILHDGGYGDLLIAGWGLEGPVHSTLRAANDRGYECLLVPDACTSLQPDLASAACEMVRFSGGIFGAFAETDAVIESLREPTQTGASR